MGPEILDKRAKAAAIREEALRKAAETKRLKELGQSAEAVTSKPADSAKQASTPDRAVATAMPAKPVVASRAVAAKQEANSQTPRTKAAAPTRNPAPTENRRTIPRSVAEIQAIQALDRHTQQGAKRETRKGTSRIQKLGASQDDVRKRPTKEEVMKMRVVDLKDVLRAAQLKVSGRKAELLE